MLDLQLMQLKTTPLPPRFGLLIIDAAQDPNEMSTHRFVQDFHAFSLPS